MDVTIIVIPRDHFSHTQIALKSIYKHTTIPFKLVYVDGGSPRKVKKFLQEQAKKEGFELIRKNHYLLPNVARNLAFSKINTKYALFIDNDVVVSRSWLKQLVQTAEQTKAALVSPLVCENFPLHEIIHFAGGEVGAKEIDGKRHFIDDIYHGHKSRKDVELERKQVTSVESHCYLVRTKIFDEVGPFDEKIANWKDHLDLCLNVAKVGGLVYFEPASVVTYVDAPPFTWNDISFYIWRWSDPFTVAGLEHLRKKWKLAKDEYFKKRYSNLGLKRYHMYVGLFRHYFKAPKMAQKMIKKGKKRGVLVTFIMNVERIFNRFHVWRIKQ